MKDKVKQLISTAITDVMYNLKQNILVEYLESVENKIEELKTRLTVLESAPTSPINYFPYSHDTSVFFENHGFAPESIYAIDNFDDGTRISEGLIRYNAEHAPTVFVGSDYVYDMQQGLLYPYYINNEPIFFKSGLVRMQIRNSENFSLIYGHIGGLNAYSLRVKDNGSTYTVYWEKLDNFGETKLELMSSTIPKPATDDPNDYRWFSFYIRSGNSGDQSVTVYIQDTPALGTLETPVAVEPSIPELNGYQSNLGLLVYPDGIYGALSSLHIQTYILD